MPIVQTDDGPKCVLCDANKAECAIDHYGFFVLGDRGNYCASLLRIRKVLVYGYHMDRQEYTDDQSAALVPLPAGRFLVLGWYKDRSRTEAAYILDEGRMRPATIVDIDEALKYADEYEATHSPKDLRHADPA